jgi:hypothetical protein
MHADERVLPFIEACTRDTNLAALLQQANAEFIKTWVVGCFDWDKITGAWQDLYDSFAHDQIPGKADEVLFLQLQLKKLVLQQDTAKKFCRQLRQLLTGNNYSLLSERVQSAASYFSELLNKEVISPFLQHLKELPANAKLKTYREDLRSLLLTAIRKEDALAKAIVVTTGLINGSSTDALLEIIYAPAPEQSEATTAAMAIPPPAEKKVSRHVTLEMFNSGLSPEAIAADRSLAHSTVEAHLVECVKLGELPLTALVTPAKIEAINAAADALQATGASPVKEKLGNDYSYTEIRAVMYVRMQAQNPASTDQQSAVPSPQ